MGLSDSPILLGSFVSRIYGKEDTIYVYKKEINAKDFNITNLEIQEAKWFSINNPPVLGPINKKIFEMYK